MFWGNQRLPYFILTTPLPTLTNLAPVLQVKYNLDFGALEAKKRIKTPTYVSVEKVGEYLLYVHVCVCVLCERVCKRERHRDSQSSRFADK